MTGPPQLTDVPLVLPEEEEPFVIRIGPDDRESLEYEGIRFRRARERCVMDIPYGGEGVGLRASMVADASGLFVYADAGALPPELWPVIGQAGMGELPVLTAGATGRPVQMTDGTTAVGVRVMPGNDRVPVTTTLIVFGPDFEPEQTLNLARMAAVPVIGAALHALTEYRTAMGNIPDVEVPTSDGSVPLDALLDLAGGMSRALGWRPGTA